MLSTLLFALGVALALFLGTNILADRYIDHKYLSDERSTERLEEYYEELQTYVTEKNLSSKDTKELSEWANDYNYLYVLIYKGDDLLFESGQDDKNTSGMGENKENADDGTGEIVTGSNNKVESDYPNSGITVRTPSKEELIAEALSSGTRDITVSDGTIHAAIADFTEYLYYDIFNIASSVLAFAGFILVMWLYFYELTKRITKLGKEVTAVADGDIERKITADGEDEITRLCSDVEYMRSSMLENIQKEHAALEANRELITAMSHDIRTPLTVLLGYMDIMKSNAPEGDMQQYIEASERTALRLKKMSDDMFGYFLVYGGGIEVDIQECDARTLIEQMLFEHVFLLREQGYEIDFNVEGTDNAFLDNVTLVTDPPQLMRIVDNVFSNIRKYADINKPVSITVGVETDEMTIKVTNFVAPNPDEAQTNGIGLRSCMKLANAMDVRFSSKEEGGVFTSLMFIPIVPLVDYEKSDVNENERGIKGWLRSVSEKLTTFFVKTWQKTKAVSVKAWQKTVKLFSRKK